MGLEEMAALAAYFDRVEKILKDGEKPESMTQELRDALMFYTADQVRRTNGGVRENRKEIRLHRWLIAAILILIGWHIGVPLLGLLF